MNDITKAAITLKIDTATSTKQLGDLFGIFFEDINHAADGGLYAELLQNGSFEFCALDNHTYNGMTAWEKVQQGAEVRTIVRTGTPQFKQNPHYLQLQMIGDSGYAGIRNIGYHSGFPVKVAAEYKFSCYARLHDNYSGTVQIKLETKDGAELALATLPALTAKWQKYELTLTPSMSCNNAYLLILLDTEGFVDVDMISLIPSDTFGQTGVFRKDIAELLAYLKPKFMRFPGGCLVADGSPDSSDRCSFYRWKNTIGAIEERPSRRNSWGYNQSMGLGFFEYFLFCEQIGAEAIPVLPVCKINGDVTPMDEIQELIDDALDLISFANDDTNTVWGAKRAELGHPQPFNMKYLALGNEEVGQPFFNLYPYFHNAIKAKYPEIQLINSGSPFAASTEYDRGWASAWENGSEYVDEHYYQSPEWFLANMDRYDSFDPSGPKVFLGEYASWGNTYYNALAEAAFMTHLEKSPAVGLACYAPLLSNINYTNWRTDLIWFNHQQVYGTPNYYVQKLFMNHQGTDELAVTSNMQLPAEPTDKPISGALVFDSKRGNCEINDLKLIENGDETTLGNQTVIMDTPQTLFDNLNGDFTLSFKARKTEAEKGRAGNVSFCVLFGHQNRENTFIWEIGGWANNDSLIGHNVSGRNSCLHQTVFSVEIGREYDCMIKVTGRKIETWIDGKLMNTAIDRIPILQPLYYCASKDSATGEIIIKAVNVKEADICVEFDLGQNGSSIVPGKLYQLSGHAMDDCNSLDEPTKILPKEIPVSYQGGKFIHTLPAHSVNVFRLNM